MVCPTLQYLWLSLGSTWRVRPQSPSGVVESLWGRVCPRSMEDNHDEKSHSRKADPPTGPSLGTTQFRHSGDHRGPWDQSGPQETGSRTLNPRVLGRVRSGVSRRLLYQRRRLRWRRVERTRTTVKWYPSPQETRNQLQGLEWPLRGTWKSYQLWVSEAQVHDRLPLRFGCEVLVPLPKTHYEVSEIL